MISGSLFPEGGSVNSDPLGAQERGELHAILNQYSADQVKRLAQKWLGKGARTRKPECIQQLLEVLGNPAALQRVYDDLTPFEKFGLYELLKRGGTLPSIELAPSLLASGYTPKESGFLHSSYYFGYRQEPYLKTVTSLFNSGLLLSVSVDSWYNHLQPTPFFKYTAVSGVALYRRIAPFVKPFPVLPLELSVCAESPHGEFRRPAQAAMPVLATIEALGSHGEFTLSARGGYPKPLINRLTKKLDTGAATGIGISDPTTFFLRLLISANLLETPDYDRSTALSFKADELAERPYEVQAGYWLDAYRSIKGWCEPLPVNLYLYAEDVEFCGPLNAFRNLVITALSALPRPDAWYTVAEFSDAVYLRTDGQLALRILHEPFPAYGSTEAQKKQKRQEFLDSRRASWRNSEKLVIQEMLRGPLFVLGLTEVGTLANGDAAFRLTDLGRAVLFGIPLPPTQTGSGETPGAWVVQPNLEIIAYLDRAQPSELAFLGRLAERKSTTGPVAVYSVTRESIYTALESGYTGEALIRGLQQSSAKALPETLLRSIQEWTTRRERIGVFLAATLLQYAGASERDAALSGLSSKAQPLGDRFVLLPDGDLNGVVGRKDVPRIDYYAAPFRCVEIDEDGTLRIDPERSDLLIASELDAVADRVAGATGNWRLSRESVQRAVGAGHTPEGILKALEVRAKSGIPAIVSVAVPRWGRKVGQPAPATLETVRVLELPSETIAEAVEGSERFKPLLKSRLGPSAFAVDVENDDAVRRLLAEYGLLPLESKTKPESPSTQNVPAGETKPLPRTRSPRKPT